MIAESNREGLYYNEETVWGETPSSPAMTAIRFLSETLGHTKETVVDNTVREDAMVDGIAEVFASAEGGINTNLRFSDYQTFLAHGLRSTWTTVTVTANTTILANAAGDYFEGEPAALGNLVAGQWIRVSGFANPANNGLFRVTNVQTIVGTPTVYRVTVDGNLVDAAASAAITIKGKILRNGTLKKSVHFEKRFNDVEEYVSIPGCRCGQINAAVESRAIVTMNFTFMGKEAIPSGDSEAGSSIPASSDDVMNATTNVGTIYEGSTLTELTTAIRAIRWNLNNNLRAIDAVGNGRAEEINYGRMEITGQLEAYFVDRSLYEKMVQHTATGLRFSVTDADGNTLVVTIPRIYLTAGNPAGGGINQDLSVPFDFQAIKGDGVEYQIQIDAIAA